MKKSLKFLEVIHKIRVNFNASSLLELDQDHLVFNFFGCNIEDSDYFILIDTLSELNNTLSLIKGKISFGIDYDNNSSHYYVGSMKISDNECNLRANTVLSEIEKICNLAEESDNLKLIRSLFNQSSSGVRMLFMILYPKYLMFFLNDPYNLDRIEKVKIFLNSIGEHLDDNLVDELGNMSDDFILESLLYYETFLAYDDLSHYLESTFEVLKYTQNKMYNFKLIHRMNQDSWYSDYYSMSDFLDFLIKSEQSVQISNKNYKITEFKSIKKDYLICCVEILREKKKQTIKDELLELPVSAYIGKIHNIAKQNNVKFELTVYVGLTGCRKHNTRSGIINFIRLLSNDHVEVDKLDAFYCSTCKKYFTHIEEFNSINHRGTLLLNITYENVSTSDYSNMPEESYFRKLKYTVNANDNLSHRQRKEIINGIVSISKSNINHMIHFINNQISNKRAIRSKDNRKAIEKWKEDITYLKFLSGRDFSIYVVQSEL